MIAGTVSRVRRSAVTTVIAVGIVATLGVDIAQATTGSAPSVASLERTYLGQLRPIALRVHNAVSPVERVMDAILQPHPGDADAARDAVLHGEALSGMRSALADVEKLSAPPQLESYQRELVSSAKLMNQSLQSVRALSSASGLRLFDAMNRLSDGLLETGEAEWQGALSNVFAKGKLTVPPGMETNGVPASRTAWIFGADRSCSAALYSSEGASVGLIDGARTVPDLATYYGHMRHTLTWINRKLAALPDPTGASALPHQLSLRLRTLAFNATVDSRLRSGLVRGDSGLIDRSLDQLTQVRVTLHFLSMDLDHYGAKTCGLVVDAWSGKGPSAPTSTDHSAVST